MLTQAVTAYQNALEVRTPESLPPQWAQTQNNLAKTYLAQGRWADAAQSFRNVLRIYPDSDESYSTLGELYHDRLFDFQAAFDLHQAWLASHPGQLAARADAAEAEFTIGRFADAEARLVGILGSAGVSADLRVALSAIEIGVLEAQGKGETIPKKLQAMVEVVSGQGSDFHLGWGWDGTVHFIQTDERLAPVRGWLLALLEAVQGKDREAVLGGLRSVAASFGVAGR